MRKPSTFMQSHGWWLDALAGKEPPRHDGLPECGYYRMRHVKGGPWVPVQVKLSQDIEFDTGELAAPERYIAVYEDWNVDATMIWDRLDPISHIEFIRLKASIGRDERLQASMVKLDLTETPTRPPKGF